MMLNFLKKNVAYVAVLCLCTGFASAQITLDWVAVMGGAVEEKANGVAVDVAGNTIITGYFNGRIFYGNDSMQAGGHADVFTAKYDTAGRLLWIRQIGGVGTEWGHSVTTDAAGNIFTTGFYNNKIYFGTDSLENVASNDVFITKQSPDGDFLWARRITGGGLDRGHSITTDPFGNLYATGYFSETALFGPTISLTSLASTHEIYVCKISNSGDFIWAKWFGGADGNDQGYTITTDLSGNVYTAGYYKTKAAFGTDTLEAMNADEEGLYLCKLDSAGNVHWVKSIDAKYPGLGRSLVVDAEKNIYLSGRFTGQGNLFDTITMNAVGSSNNAFISKFDTAGNIIWAKGFGGTNSTQATGIALDAWGNIYASGFYNGTSYFGTDTLVSPGGQNGFLCRLGNDGTLQWTKNLGYKGGDGLNGVFTGPKKGIYVTGYFGDTTNFNLDTTAAVTRIGKGNTDIFVARYTPYKVWVDSIDVQTAGNVPAAISTTAGTLQMEAHIFPEDADVQDVTWSIVPGTGSATISTTGLVTAQTDGTVYAKAVSTDDPAIMDSLMITITGQVTESVQGMERANGLQVYPNPAGNILYINTPSATGTVSLYNITGSLITEQRITGSQATLDISPLAPGSYLLQYSNGTRYKPVRFIKQ